MAAGDFTLFEEFAAEIGDKIHDFAADTFKIGIIDNTTPPTAADATPRWGDYSANEVSTAGGYTADGETLDSVTFTEVDGVGTFDATDETIAQNGSGFTDGYWAILYNDTATNDEAIGFIELDGPSSEVAGAVVFTWNASGIFTVTV